MTSSMLVILLSVTACTVGAWVYFQRIRMPRPPIGVFTLGDVLIIFVCILLISLLYIWLTGWIVLGLLLLSGLSLIYVALEPLGCRSLIWGLTIGLIGANLVSGFMVGTQHPLHQALNNVFVVLSVISISNTWAQTGMKARDAAVLGSLLIVYDFMATTQYALMGDLFTHVQNLPLAPLIAWGRTDQYVAIGLGDLLMLTVFPLTMCKGFGMFAGRIALGIGLAAVAGLVVLPIKSIFPVMVLLGPLMAGQYLFWRYQSPEHSLKERYQSCTPAHNQTSLTTPHFN